MYFIRTGNKTYGKRRRPRTNRFRDVSVEQTDCVQEWTRALIADRRETEAPSRMRTSNENRVRTVTQKGDITTADTGLAWDDSCSVIIVVHSFIGINVVSMHGRSKVL